MQTTVITEVFVKGGLPLIAEGVVTRVRDSWDEPGYTEVEVDALYWARPLPKLHWVRGRPRVARAGKEITRKVWDSLSAQDWEDVREQMLEAV